MADSKTPQLYDKGEESWELKVHAGCGSIYLEGYTNADVAGYHPYESPELLEANKTTVTDYWGRKKDHDLHIEPYDKEKTALDLIADLRELPYHDQVDKIICLQKFEHLTLNDANRTVLSWWNALKTGGILILSVPDPTAIAKLIDFDSLPIRQWAIKHLLGDGVNAYALHHWSYTEQNLRQLLESYGFVDVQRLEGVHFYPSITMKAKKSDPWVPGRSYQRLPRLGRHWRILDIGPGNFPLAEATEYADITAKKRGKLGGKPLHKVDLDEELPFADDFYDFVYCSHVLEHIDSPVFGLKEIQRVGRAGFVEVPSVLLDFMMRQGETHPKWVCWGAGQALYFIEKTDEQNRLFLDWERVWGAFFHHAVHGLHLDAVQRAIRAYFWQNQHLLNLMAFWDKSKGLEIVGMEARLAWKS